MSIQTDSLATGKLAARIMVEIKIKTNLPWQPRAEFSGFVLRLHEDVANAGQ